MKITINGLNIPIAEKYEIVLDAGEDGEMGPVHVRLLGRVSIASKTEPSITVDGTHGVLSLPGRVSPVSVGIARTESDT